MLYFTHHPKISYTLNADAFKMVDIFRRNFIKFKDNTTFDFLLSNNETPEKVANIMYGDETLSWIINLSNNIQLASDWKFTTDLKVSELIEKHKNTKIYSIKGLPELSSGDVLVAGQDLYDGFSPTMDNFVVIRKWDPHFRSIEVVELIAGFGGEGVTLSALRENTTTESFDIVAQGLTLGRKTDYIEFPIKFIDIDKNYISPYTNPSNSIIYSADIQGISFEDTLLGKFIDSESTSPYISITPMYEIINDGDISIDIPKPENVFAIEDLSKTALGITDKFRTYTITIG